VNATITPPSNQETVFEPNEKIEISYYTDKGGGRMRATERHASKGEQRGGDNE